MIGSIVNHPLFGRGQVVELRNAAREVAVSFDNGIRAVVPVRYSAVRAGAVRAVVGSIFARFAVAILGTFDKLSVPIS